MEKEEEEWRKGEEEGGEVEEEGKSGSVWERRVRARWQVVSRWVPDLRNLCQHSEQWREEVWIWRLLASRRYVRIGRKSWWSGGSVAKTVGSRSSVHMCCGGEAGRRVRGT